MHMVNAPAEECIHQKASFSFAANSSVERRLTDDLMPNIPIFCLPLSSVECGPRSSGTEDRRDQFSCVTLRTSDPSPVVLGRPTVLRQSAGGRSAAAMTRSWSFSGAVRAKCPKNLSRRVGVT